MSTGKKLMTENSSKGLLVSSVRNSNCERDDKSDRMKRARRLHSKSLRVSLKRQLFKFINEEIT